MGKTADLDMSPADTANELAKARARIAELEAKSLPSIGPSFTASTEIDAGVETVEDADGKLVETQYWWYRIDMPASGGFEIRLNGTSFYQGQQYKVQTNTLRCLKDIVARTHQHEAQISGSNENFYRKPQERTLRGGGR